MVMDDLCGFNLFLFRHMLFCSREKKRDTRAQHVHRVQTKNLSTSHKMAETASEHIRLTAIAIAMALSSLALTPHRRASHPEGPSLLFGRVGGSLAPAGRPASERRSPTRPGHGAPKHLRSDANTRTILVVILQRCRARSATGGFARCAGGCPPLVRSRDVCRSSLDGSKLAEGVNKCSANNAAPTLRCQRCGAVDAAPTIRRRRCSANDAASTMQRQLCGADDAVTTMQRR